MTNINLAELKRIWSQMVLNDTWFSDISHDKRHTTQNMLRTDYAGDLLNVPDPVLDGDDNSLRQVLEQIAREHPEYGVPRTMVELRE